MGFDFDFTNWVTTASWIGFLLVTGHIWLLGNKNPRDRVVGFILGLLSCVAWGYVGIKTSNGGLFALQIVIAIVIIRGIINNIKMLRK